MTNLADTSVPSWVLEATEPVLDTSGLAYLLIGVGVAAEPLLQKWREDLADRSVEFWIERDSQRACEVLVDALRRAHIGIRVAVVGPPGACLALRAAALRAGLEDDEFIAATTGTGPLEVFCTHCRAAAPAAAGIGDTVVCNGCMRSLVVYHHVSRLRGQFMGYMADAEVLVP
jgi:hypothetical protein